MFRRDRAFRDIYVGVKNSQKSALLLAILASLLIPSLLSAAEPWQAVVRERLKLYGHRNWIVVADSAYPAQSAAGIETIVCDADQTEVLRFVLARIDESHHVRPVIYLDKELAMVPEGDAPGVSQYRRNLSGLFGERHVTELPHESIIGKLDETSQKFRVMILKTTMTIPYTSVFFQLDAGYWSADSEKRLREALAAASRN